jgi:hypothetical protein
MENSMAEQKDLDQHTLGAKLDAGKPKPGLVIGGFANALSEVVKVGTYGASKYTEDGWMFVENADKRYMDAMYRHLLEHHKGYEFDEESGLSHLAHAAWNLLAVLAFDCEKE